MKRYFIFTLTALMFACSGSVFSQGKYFVLNYYKATGKGISQGARVELKTVSNDAKIILPFKGKTEKQLYDALKAYVKDRPSLKTTYDKGVENGSFEYRDFSIIGKIDKHLADLVGLTYIGVGFNQPGALQVSIGISSHIYASIFGAKLEITPDNDVASVNDAPFNEYQFIQPAYQKLVRGKLELKQAYPDSIFDLDGKIVNANNKSAIENYYDRYITDLKNYLDKKLK